MTVLVLLSICSLASAQSKWTLTTADFQTRQVDLIAIDDTGATMTDGAQQRVAWDNLLLLSRDLEAKPAAGKFVLHLASGDRISGQPLKLDGETLRWNASSIGEMGISLRDVKAMTRADRPQPAANEQRTEDVVVLVNRDTLRGILSDISAEQITINAGGTPTPVPIDSVASLQLAATNPSAPSAERAIRVRLTDDSVVTAKAVRLGAQKLALALPGAGGTRELPIDSVAAIEQVNGPVSWLSSRPPSEIVHTPFLQTPRAPKMDRTVTGDRIGVGDRTYARGIGVAPYTKITWPLDGAYDTFRTQYAIDGGGAYADVTVRVLLDGKVAHERKNVTAGEVSPVVLVPLAGAKSLTLEVDFGGNFNVQDRFVWIEPALVNDHASQAPQPNVPQAPTTRP